MRKLVNSSALQSWKWQLIGIGYSIGTFQNFQNVKKLFNFCSWCRLYKFV